MYKGLHGSYFPVCPLNSYSNRFLRFSEKSSVELIKRNETRVQLREIANIDLYAKVFHCLCPP